MALGLDAFVGGKSVTRAIGPYKQQVHTLIVNLAHSMK
jgi:hypothetical protein